MNKRNYNKIFEEKKEETPKGFGKTADIMIVDEFATAEKEPQKQITATVISRGKLNIRELPDKDSSIVCVVSPGSQLQVVDKRDGWTHVYTSAGIEGYAMTEFIKED